ncbi:MAG: mechanosensitive ion channel [Bacteroidales bacterium]|nr:mechanosensitive ion channel [Bacteroidales bacterium]
MKELKEILNIELFNINENTFKLSNLLLILVIFLGTKILLWIVKSSFKRKTRNRKDEKGNYLAIYQLIKYFAWVVAIIFIIETLGIDVTVLIAGSAALLVGIGMGLQQTFNDFISGIILLSEGSIKVGDVLEINGDVVIVKHIGIRTSKVINREDIIIIVPNSLITSNSVINWSHQSEMSRFSVEVGVAYGSDIDLVINILEESAKEHKKVANDHKIEARFLDFADSSLNFQILFFSEDVFRIEGIKSDIRKIIYKKFIENNIKIPFPQMDVHLDK